MLSKRLLSVLNEQITHELNAAHIYTAMAAYCVHADLDGCSNFFLVQAEEERFHAMKLFNYVGDQNAEIKIGALENPYNEYENVLEVFKAALEHEKLVTSQIYKMMDIATEEREYATISFLNWYVDEQVEEEASFNTLIKKFTVAIKDDNMLHMLDQELGQRTFTPPPLNAE